MNLRGQYHSRGGLASTPALAATPGFASTPRISVCFMMKPCQTQPRHPTAWWFSISPIRSLAPGVRGFRAPIRPILSV